MTSEQSTSTLKYAYDTAGNITTVTVADNVRKQFIYDNSDWKDLLTKVKIGSAEGSIEYEKDAAGNTIGNPITYFNGADWEFTWTNGRQLATAYSDAWGADMSFTYGVDGVRTSKTVNGVTYHYLYQNGRVARQYWTSQNNISYIMDFLYDPQGKPLSVRFTVGGNTTSYYYETNLQGDVTKIYKADASSGSLKMVKMCDYGYNAWGSVIVQDKTSADTQNITSLNPIRYRGYYLDTESGFYYLQSRYYDPEIYRFINADSAIPGVGGSFIGHNLFAYCSNNPVNMSDPNGNWPKWVARAYRAFKNTAKRIVSSVSRFARITSRLRIRLKVSSSEHNANRRPNTGTPGSTYRAPNGDTRTFDPDGAPARDYDHDDHGQPDKHPHDDNGGHSHDWENGVRGPAYSMGWEPIVGGALALGCIIGIIIIAADDATGIGVADDFLLGPLGAGVEEGFTMIFR